eukprot:TRINITY_DN111932_c0_g1_i1.p1 TRINITY_DN111932_c0_g1~~TRINITY_DN111932_c0_g1_i1.p1  ORF type:complete len:162 (+),score=28.67 TRINITY_DN111932_c0_g1_i1:206-691(+)
MRHKADPAFHYYIASPLAMKNFNASSLPKPTQKCSQDLNRIGRSFSETMLKAVREDAQVRETMARRYHKVMRSRPAAPPPTRRMMNQVRLPQISAARKEQKDLSLEVPRMSALPISNLPSLDLFKATLSRVSTSAPLLQAPKSASGYSRKRSASNCFDGSL